MIYILYLNNNNNNNDIENDCNRKEKRKRKRQLFSKNGKQTCSCFFIVILLY